MDNKNLHFKFLSYKSGVRDFFHPPVKILKNTGAKKSQSIKGFSLFLFYSNF